MSRKPLLVLILILGSSFFTLCEGQYTILHSFNDTTGRYPYGSLTSSSTGDTLYGMTFGGGQYQVGCVFFIVTNGSEYDTIHNFRSGIGGGNPVGSLIRVGNVLYGMTKLGGQFGYGVIFSVHTDGSAYNTLHSFGSGTDGEYPYGSLTLSGNVLYGMTPGGGKFGEGSIFSIHTDGTLYDTLHSFGWGTFDGLAPNGDLTLYGNVLYGMTNAGGKYTNGNIFSIHTDGTLYDTLHNFGHGTDGGRPYGSLISAGNTLYGMTYDRGQYGSGNIFSIYINGTLYDTLHNFGTGIDGEFPYGSLILSRSILYGMTEGNGGGYGNIFSINTDGTLYDTLHNFGTGIDGEYPHGSLVLSGNVFYGMTYMGGLYRYGVIFSLKDTTGALGVYNLSSTPNSINLYPNPSDGQFTIQSSAVNGNPDSYRESVEVYNVLGEQVYSNSYQPLANSQQRIDLSSEPNGIYLYRVIGESGELLGEGKLVIQK